MAFGGDDDRRRKGKMTKPHGKPMSCRGRGCIAASSYSAAARGDARDRGRRD